MIFFIKSIFHPEFHKTEERIFKKFFLRFYETQDEKMLSMKKKSFLPGVCL